MSCLSSAGMRRGVVAVIQRDDGRLLVVRRSATVAAPLAYCFPGGAIEPGETEQQALQRELFEELALRIVPIEQLWECVAPWGVYLSWWSARLSYPHQTPSPNLSEVIEARWLLLSEIWQLPGLLSTNRAFLKACSPRLESPKGIEIPGGNRGDSGHIGDTPP
ncbi:MAG: hypothetical protein KatS3mg110_1394 [Pirellulaceae bacterium]|nr:MAG: hypothetical protein KatS3mg110_1394 [Pirellulaceae bacterium]